MRDRPPSDPDRDTRPGRGQDNGEWPGIRLQQALEAWGYATERRVPIVAMPVDVVACCEDHRTEPADYIVAECKD